MKKALLLSAAVAGLAGMSAGAFAQTAYPAYPAAQPVPQAQPQEMGRVLSSTPVTQQVGVPRQVCTNQPVAVQQGGTGAGAAVGAIAGGAMGNAIGQGSGRAAATMLGLVGGALLGNRIEGPGSTTVQNVQQCSTQTVYENRTVAYNVVYEYAGKQYTVQMPNDPGQYVRLQVTPVSANGASQPGVVLADNSTVQTVVTVPSTVVYPAGYYRPYPYYPIALSVGFGYGYGHRGHWR